MEVFFDKDFISKHKWHFERNDDIYVSFYYIFIKKLTGLKVFLNVDEGYFKNKDLLSDEEKFFIQAINDSNPETVYHGNPTDKKGWITDICKSGGFKIFFYELERDCCTLISSNLGYIVISSLNFNEIWKNFINTTIVKHYNKEADKGNNLGLFNDWDDLNFIGNLPNNSIILADSYLFKNTEHDIALCKHNLIPLLWSIAPKGYKGFLNIVIVFSDAPFETKNMHRSHLYEFLGLIHNEIVCHFENEGYEAKLQLFFINDLTKSHRMKKKFHSRFIYTNYYWINFEFGINLFKYQNDKRKYERIIRQNGFLQITHTLMGENKDLHQTNIDNLKEYIIYAKEQNQIFIDSEKKNKTKESKDKDSELNNTTKESKDKDSEAEKIIKRMENLAYRLIFYPQDKPPECNLLKMDSDRTEH